jgi:succinate dehydrogenase/fumarate reductase flavoprotein subunit
MEKYDTIIVGAGPAGLEAARVLAALRILSVSSPSEIFFMLSMISLSLMPRLH